MSFDQREGVHERTLDRLAGDREVLDRPLGLGTPQGVGGHTHLAHGVVLDPVSQI
jgi:hypothetical protein